MTDTNNLFGNALSPLVVFLDVQDIVLTDFLNDRDEALVLLESMWAEIFTTIDLVIGDEAFSPLSMLTSVRGHGDVSCM